MLFALGAASTAFGAIQFLPQIVPRNPDVAKAHLKEFEELTGMMKELMKRAKKEGLNLAPFIGIAFHSSFL